MADGVDAVGGELSSNGHPDPLDNMHTEAVHFFGTFTWVVQVVNDGESYRVTMLDVTGIGHTYVFDRTSYGVFRIMLEKTVEV